MLIQFRPSITIGNQKWNGAIPIFIINVEESIILIKISNFIITFKVKTENKIIKNNKILEAKAWVKKYFNEASDVKILFVFIIKGMKDNKLISKPIQILNQEVDVILIIDPKNKVIKNNIL